MARAKKHPHDPILLRLRELGMKYPGAHFKSPWPGHMDLAVNDKTFAYLSLEGEALGISCKLPHSSGAALLLPFTKPTAYGLGKSGWVSASYDDADVPDFEMLAAWIDESYRAQAPKKLVKQLDAGGASSSAKTSAPAKKAAKASAPAKKAAKASVPAKAKKAAKASVRAKKKAARR